MFKKNIISLQGFCNNTYNIAYFVKVIINLLVINEQKSKFLFT